MYRLIKNIYILSFITIIIFVISWYMQHQLTNRQMVENAQQMATMSADSLSKDISLHLSTQAMVIEAAAAVIAQNNWNEQEILALLTTLLNKYDSFDTIYFGSIDNQMINASGWVPPDDFDLRSRPWYIKAADEKNIILTEAFLNASEDLLIFTIACPVYTHNEKLIGVVGGDMSIRKIDNLINNRDAETEGLAFLIDSRNNILAHPEITYNPNRQIINIFDYYDNLEDLTITEGLIINKLRLNSEEGYLAYMPIAGTDWHLATFIPLIYFKGASSHLNSQYIMATLATLLVFALFLFYHNRWIHKPLLEFEKSIKQIDLEKMHTYRLPIALGTEFAALGQTINLLLDKTQSYLEKLEEKEKSLTAANQELEKMLGELTTAEEALDYSEEKLYYLSYHDQLTGLYNRAFFEAKLRYLSSKPEYPISIISADINGLKLINDTLSHSAGNKLIQRCASIISDALDGSGILARVGGDEFAAILPLTGKEETERIARQIRYQVTLYNQEHSSLPLSLSLGVATTTDKGSSLKKLFKEADDLMFRSKLYNSASARNGVVQSLMAALTERDNFMEGHIRRLEKLCLKVGEIAGLASHQITDLALLAQVHDLGKVGIPDYILHKPGPLTEEEWDVMKQHPEKGFRIAASAPDLANIANLILRHHEHWDGSGYPLGLSDHSIPIECRILAVVDAFDLMTHDRPYRKAIGKDKALEELANCAGKQFDPEIVAIFLRFQDDL